MLYLYLVGRDDSKINFHENKNKLDNDNIKALWHDNLRRQIYNSKFKTFTMLPHRHGTNQSRVQIRGYTYSGMFSRIMCALFYIAQLMEIVEVR